MTMSVNKSWLCIRCGYIHTDAEPPIFCPICQASKKEFLEATDEVRAQYEHLLADKE